MPRKLSCLQLPVGRPKVLPPQSDMSTKASATLVPLGGAPGVAAFRRGFIFWKPRQPPHQRAEGNRARCEGLCFRGAARSSVIWPFRGILLPPPPVHGFSSLEAAPPPPAAVNRLVALLWGWALSLFWVVAICLSTASRIWAGAMGGPGPLATAGFPRDQKRGQNVLHKGAKGTKSEWRGAGFQKWNGKRPAARGGAENHLASKETIAGRAHGCKPSPFAPGECGPAGAFQKGFPARRVFSPAGPLACISRCPNQGRRGPASRFWFRSLVFWCVGGVLVSRLAPCLF